MEYNGGVDKAIPYLSSSPPMLLPSEENGKYREITELYKKIKVVQSVKKSEEIRLTPKR
jgi:hypothetical protein